MNTVKHFVKISTQKLEIIQRKVAKRINCLPLHHFVSNFGFAGVDNATFEIMIWLNRLNPCDVFLADWPLTELSFDTASVDFMNGCVNSFISKIVQIWVATTSRAL